MKQIIVVLAFALSTSSSFGQNLKVAKITQLMEIGIEYLAPTKLERQIETTSLNLLYGSERHGRFPFTLQFGLTATYAWGNITQLDASFSKVTTENNALGMGSIFVTRFELLSLKKFSISPFFSGGIILYSENFPHGGNIYNFIWRYGGIFHFQLNNSIKLNLAGKWMHVSNGQGLNHSNPSYEGKGIEISITKRINSRK